MSVKSQHGYEDRTKRGILTECNEVVWYSGEVSSNSVPSYHNGHVRTIKSFCGLPVTVAQICTDALPLPTWDLSDLDGGAVVVPEDAPPSPRGRDLGVVVLVRGHLRGSRVCAGKSNIPQRRQVLEGTIDRGISSGSPPYLREAGWMATERGCSGREGAGLRAQLD